MKVIANLLHHIFTTFGLILHKLYQRLLVGKMHNDLNQVSMSRSYQTPVFSPYLHHISSSPWSYPPKTKPILEECFLDTGYTIWYYNTKFLYQSLKVKENSCGVLSQFSCSHRVQYMYHWEQHTMIYLSFPSRKVVNVLISC